MNLVLHRSLSTHLVVVLIASWTSTTWAQHRPNQESAVTHAAAPAGDPYTLDVDPVTGEKLQDIKQQIIIDQEGRELRFESTDSVEQFKADPGRYLPTVDERIITQQWPYYALETCRIEIPLASLPLGQARHFEYSTARGPIRFFADRMSAELVRTALDECETCNSERSGYAQSGTEMIYRDCGNGVPIGLVGKRSGGCNPIHLHATLHGENVAIEVASLVSAIKRVQDDGG